MPWARYKRMCCAIKLCHCERSEAIPRHCEDSSLRAAFSREELSDVAGSNPQPRAAGSASPPHAVTTSAAVDLRHVALSFEKQ